MTSGTPKMHEMTLTDQAELTRAVMHMLDVWGLRDEDQLAVLGFPPGTPKQVLRRYRQGTPFPTDNLELMERVEHLVGIAEALRTTFPRDPAMTVVWLQRANRRFGGRAPLAVMIDDGLDGLIAIRAHLDCIFAWQSA